MRLLHFWKERAVIMQNGNMPPSHTARTSAYTENTSEKRHIRFEKCIGCADIGPGCLGPNLLTLSISELRVWVKRWKEYYRLSGDQCAAIWNTPVGTVSRFLATQETDFKYMTVQGIIRGIVSYGQPADQDFGDNPCPATSAEIQAQMSVYEQQIAEKTEECASLAAKKLERANEYTERMAEQRENYEKHLSEKADTIAFFRGLAEKRQHDLEKEEAQSANYLARIDTKNQQIIDRDAEIKRLNYDLLRMASTHAEETKNLIDRILRMTEEYAAEIKALNQIIAGSK